MINIAVGRSQSWTLPELTDPDPGPVNAYRSAQPDNHQNVDPPKIVQDQVHDVALSGRPERQGSHGTLRPLCVIWHTTPGRNLQHRTSLGERSQGLDRKRLDLLS